MPLIFIGLKGLGLKRMQLEKLLCEQGSMNKKSSLKKKNKEKYYGVHYLRLTESGDEIIKTVVVLSVSPGEAVNKAERLALHNQIDWPSHHKYDTVPLALLEADKAKVKFKERFI